MTGGLDMVLMKKAGRGGRPRKSGDRYPSGGLRPLPPPDYALLRRAEKVGVGLKPGDFELLRRASGGERLNREERFGLQRVETEWKVVRSMGASQQAGYALGQLLMRGILSKRQHDAALRFASNWSLWAAKGELGSHILRRTNGGGGGEPSPQEWRRAKEAYLEARAILELCHPRVLVSVAIEQVVMDEEVASILEGRAHPRAIKALRIGLDALADHYNLGEDGECAEEGEGEEK